MKRPRGYGSVFKRGRIWWFRTRTGEMAESSRSTRKTDAEDQLDARLAEARCGMPAVASANRATFDDLEQLLLADMRANERRSTANVEKYRLPYLWSQFGRFRVQDITYSTAQAYIAHRLASAAPATVSIEMKLLRRMLVLAHRARILGAVPALPSVSVQNTRVGFCSPQEIERVIDHLPAHAKPVVRCLYLCGWRSSEVLQLQWSRVDFAAQTMRLDARDTKTSRPRTFPFGRLPDLDGILREQRAVTTELEHERGMIIPWVFHLEGQPVRSIRTAWRRAVRLAGLPALLPHDLRRSAARNLIRAGVSEGVTMALMGHRTRHMLDRYNITDAADLSEGVARLNEFLAKGSVRREVER